MEHVKRSWNYKTRSEQLDLIWTKIYFFFIGSSKQACNEPETLEEAKGEHRSERQREEWRGRRHDARRRTRFQHIFIEIQKSQIKTFFKESLNIL